jgi:N4-gp56 family major capsid protein
METIQKLAETQASDVRGASSTTYGLEPIQYLKEIVDGAKTQLFFANFVAEITAPAGVHDVILPKRTVYEGASMTYDTTERIGSDISWTTLDNLTSVIATPAPVIAGYALSNFSLRTNAVNLLKVARDELSYSIGNRVDSAIAVALGDATVATNAVRGAQTLYGGDATSAATLEAGDVITTDLVAKAARYLKDTRMYYRASGAYGTETLSAVAKNPWSNDNSEPFVLFISPAQEETFRKDSQFVNAAEYGSNKVVMNGEIGEYLGIKVVVTTNCEQTAAAGTAPDGTTAAVACTRCIMMKAKRAAALVWGQKPEIKVFDYPTRDQTRISLVSAYAIKVVQDDAIVFADVALV